MCEPYFHVEDIGYQYLHFQQSPPPAIMGTFSYSWLKITGLTCCEDFVIVI